MKYLLVLVIGVFASCQVNSQKTLRTTPDPAKKILLVEATCGECQFHMKGHGCELAVRVDGKDYYVDGTSIDDHGDAHGEAGFCETIRKAEVQGEIVDNRFKATYFKLKPFKEEKNKLH